MNALMNRRLATQSKRESVGMVGAALAFMLFYMIAFPKGGVKAGTIPLTFGYVLSGPMTLLAMAHARQLSVPLDRMLAFLPCLLLALWSALVVYANGTESLGFTIAYFISILYLPLFGLICFSPLLLDRNHQRIERAFVWAVRFIVGFGVFLFVFKQVTGSWIEVPYLTVNAADAGNLDDKYINRGGIFKLISTYNNGNIFGVSIAILAPLYLSLEKKGYLRVALYVSMVLTLSRTVWIALLLVVLLRALSRGLRPMTILYLALGLIFALTAIYFALGFLGLDLAFVFDSNLGGRAGQLRVLDNAQIIPNVRTDAIPEIAYLGVLYYYGIPGLLLFFCFLLTPPLLLWLEGTPLFSLSRATACLQGLLVYSVLAAADAAFSYIPVMMFFWIIAGWGFWYAHRQARLVRDYHAPAR